MSLLHVAGIHMLQRACRTALQVSTGTQMHKSTGAKLPGGQTWINGPTVALPEASSFRGSRTPPAPEAACTAGVPSAALQLQDPGACKCMQHEPVKAAAAAVLPQTLDAKISSALS